MVNDTIACIIVYIRPTDVNGSYAIHSAAIGLGKAPASDKPNPL